MDGCGLQPSRRSCFWSVPGWWPISLAPPTFFEKGRHTLTRDGDVLVHEHPLGGTTRWRAGETELVFTNDRAWNGVVVAGRDFADILPCGDGGLPALEKATLDLIQR